MITVVLLTDEPTPKSNSQKLLLGDEFQVQVLFQLLSKACCNFEMQTAGIIVLHLHMLLKKPGGFAFPSMKEETIF